MTQKDKVKELVGRGLHSYHTKALQQMDRIEKKNKEQNHKISILTNELDNDYLTKSEEGSVVSLEHSKEGMVYLDELQGNTLVNYCTDGSKEMTLNGDIDVEGTFVNTTEGVDNGLVDVMCEGNTLVNLSPNTFEIGCPNEEATTTFWFSGEYINNSLFKPNTEYSVIFYNKHPEVVRVYFHLGEPREKHLVNNMAVFTTPSTITTDKSIIHFYTNSNLSKQQIEQSNMKVVILEGDWTNREIPPYFESMKSVGQDDVNGHKIEILSQSSYPNLIKKSKNLSGNGIGSDTSNHNGVQYLIEDNVEFARVSANKQDFSNFYWWLQTVEPRKKGETYTISYDYRCTSDWGGYWYPSESYVGSFFPSTNGEWRRMKITRTVTGGDTKENMLFGVSIRGVEIGDYIDIKNVKMEKGTNNSKWIPSVMDEEFLLAKYSNKKEILLNEPLRSTPKVKDKFVKIGRRWFIERNCGEITLNGTQTITLDRFVAEKENQITFFIYIEDMLSSAIQNDMLNLKCDKFTITREPITNENIEGMSCFEKEIRVHIIKNKLSIASVDGFKTWLQNNPTKVVYQLAIPTYEEITDPILLTYLDTTHISNNSIVPCNMKIQNSGYNAIIKPSTLYTIALDTNKSGTIGMNLGGAKGTTTNNVLKLTTPTTLSDDSLRLYGKGIKGSKVRLLEGDKTNWIPRHFEGMKSSFEDKLQDDGTYKMEISSNNENLFNEDILQNINPSYYQIVTKDGRRCLYGERPSLLYRNRLTNQLKPNTSYTIAFDMMFVREVGQAHGLAIGVVYTNGMSNTVYASSYNNWANIKLTTPSDRSIAYIHLTYGTNTPTYIDLDSLIIKESNSNDNHVSHKSNKIQFSSIEPLRGVDDIKDRFILKDNKLMIERNCKRIIVDNKLSWVGFDTSVTPNHPRAYFLLDDYNLNKRSHCDGFGYINADKEFRHFKAHPFGLERIKTIVWFYVENAKLNSCDQQGFVEYFKDNTFELVYPIKEPIYEEIPFELQKIILEGYENGTLFFDTNIPPTSTITYAGETPIVKATKLNKTEVSNNTNDINDNIIPYLMDMDYRVVCLQLESNIEGISMSRLFGGAYEMLKRDILSKRLTKEEYGYRLTDYFNAGKLTEEEVRELEDLK